MYQKVLRTLGIITLFCLLFAERAWADKIKVAVATNFIYPMRVLQADFQKKYDHELILSFASSGKLYAQIKNGAPFDVFLSADQDKPNLLTQDLLAIEDTQFTYAQGRLVIWARLAGLFKSDMNQIDVEQAILKAKLNKIAIANPRFAPYGQAALETLKQINVLKARDLSLIKGENIAHAFQFVHTGNADLGLIALSQAKKYENGDIGSFWLIPKELHNPINQDAIMLSRATQNVAAASFLSYLKSPETQKLIESFGYTTVLH